MCVVIYLFIFLAISNIAKLNTLQIHLHKLKRSENVHTGQWDNGKTKAYLNAEFVNWQFK